MEKCCVERSGKTSSSHCRRKRDPRATTSEPICPGQSGHTIHRNNATRPYKIKGTAHPHPRNQCNKCKGNIRESKLVNSSCTPAQTRPTVPNHGARRNVPVTDIGVTLVNPTSSSDLRPSGTQTGIHALKEDIHKEMLKNSTLRAVESRRSAENLYTSIDSTEPARVAL